jgi:phage gp46-like protein
MSQQGDVRLFQTNDGGDISVTLGLVDMDGGLETAAYLSLFGGNEDDDGGGDPRFSWWANLAENDADFQYRSETQNLLQSLVVSPQNLRRIEDAAGRDLAWMVTKGVASRVEVAASVQGLNKVLIEVTIEAEGDETEFVFAENWKASA